ncbi:MAG: hypothetical protein KDD25_06725 [Bdellovibrionales bacterium]|nr:hypothetical protein [Bdellovibrionales bacterium]
MRIQGRNRLRFILFLMMGIHLASCSSTSEVEYTDDVIPDREDMSVGYSNRDRHPASLDIDSFTVNKARVKRPKNDSGPTQFFFKACEQTTSSNYYSMHSYFCDSL